MNPALVTLLVLVGLVLVAAVLGHIDRAAKRDRARRKVGE